MIMSSEHAPSSSPAPPELPFDQIQFARRAPGAAKPNLATSLVLGFGWSFVLMGLTWIGAAFGVGRHPVLIAVIAGTLPFLTTYFVRAVRRGRKFRALDRDLPDADARLVCLGLPEEIRNVGPMLDVPFEPRLFQAYLIGPHGASRWLEVVLALVILPLVHAVRVLVRPATGWVEFVEFGAWELLASAMLATGASLWLWPTYLRVTPRRLDVLRASTIRGSILACDRYDLGSARLVVDLRNNGIVIEAGGRRADINIGTVLRKFELAHALFWAAMNTHNPPELPQDRLLG